MLDYKAYLIVLFCFIVINFHMKSISWLCFISNWNGLAQGFSIVALLTFGGV